MVCVLVCLLPPVGTARAGAILVDGKSGVTGLNIDNSRFENNTGQLSGAIAVLIGLDQSGITPVHHSNIFTNNIGVSMNIPSAGAYYLANVGNKRITFYGTTATGNQGGGAGFMTLLAPSVGSHAITFRDSPSAVGTAPNQFSSNFARTPHPGPGGAGVLFSEGNGNLTLAISYTTFNANTGNRYGGVIGIQGGTANVLNIGASVTFTGHGIGPIGLNTSPFTGKTVVCASSAPPPAVSGSVAFTGIAPSPLVSCFNVTECKGLCTSTATVSNQTDCAIFCDEVGARSALSASSSPPKIDGPWVQNSNYTFILARPSNAFICNNACWSEL